MHKVLIAGATGVVGQTALEHFIALPDWEVIAVSRSKPFAKTGFVHLAIDLMDEQRCREVLSEMSDITHVVYAALRDREGSAGSSASLDSIDDNYRMLRNLLEPLTRAARNLQHVSILQGTKAYGVHIKPFPAPAKERWPRVEHANFYFLQEDYLKHAQVGTSWNWTIFRPQLIFGFAVGKALNLIPVIGALAAICREEGQPMGFPGISTSILEATDARLLASAFQWAGMADEAHNEIFNITNGDIFIWPNVWPSIAESLQVETAPGQPFIVSNFFKEKAELWEKIVRKYQLQPVTLPQLMGQSDVYSDVSFTYSARQTAPGLLSTIKLRKAGFNSYYDTEDAFRYWFDLYAARGLLPGIRQSL